MNHCGAHFWEVAAELVESVARVTGGEFIGEVCTDHSVIIS